MISDDELCLEYIPPAVVNGKSIGLIEARDMESEVAFWESSIACYVLGENPPITVMEGFIRRIWGNHGIERVVAKGEGVFIVRFESTIERDEVLAKRVYFFDKKPMVMKPWRLGEEVNKGEVVEIPIWVQFPKPDLRFWGSKGLSKVASILGKPLKADKFMKEKKLVNYARVLIDIDITKEIPETVTIVDDLGEIIKQKVELEWQPIKCSKCSMFGHKDSDCRKGVRRVWMRKEQVIQQPIVQDVEVQDGIVEDIYSATRFNQAYHLERDRKSVV